MFLILLFALAGSAVAFPEGAPNAACSDMIPNHGVGAQTTPSPYTMTVSKMEDEGQDVYQVSITGTFKGFFIQAREIGNEAPSADQLPLGTFDIVDTSTTQTRPCEQPPEDNGVTHTSNADKQSVEVVWRPTNVASLDGVQIVATIVQSKEVFWVGERKPLPTS